MPEVDEEVHNDVTKGNLFADDPFASAPMPKNISQQRELKHCYLV